MRVSRSLPVGLVRPRETGEMSAIYMTPAIRNMPVTPSRASFQ